ncbi:MAG: SUMF1/EgtB/PvdO family nonheme iron enzyme, partial [Patescibacteria group bacterium]
TTGDVQIGSDLVFTDNLSASILSNAPMYITAGDPSQNVSLYLKGSGYGGMVVVEDMMQVYLSTTTLETVFSIATSTGTVFKVDSYGRTYGDGAYASPSADYAEYFYSEDIDLVSGETVCVDITRDNAVKRCTRGADGNLMGIVSTRPVIIGNSPIGRENNKNYKIIGMLGQVPAKVSTENGPIRPGDSLTSASSNPGYVMKAGPGDPTVGVALESLDAEMISPATTTASTTVPARYENKLGEVNVLISRRNKSLTVEEVENTVLERIAAMEIEDEVQIMVQNTVDAYDFDPVVTEIIGSELASLSSGFDGKLSVQKDELTNLINSKSLTTQQGLAALAAAVDENGVLIADLVLHIADLSEEIDYLKNGTLNIEYSILNIDANSTSSALSVAQAGDGNIAEFKQGTTTVLAIAQENGQPVVKLANDVKLAFGDEEEVMMAYNSDTHQMEVVSNDRDLYISLGAGKMIVAGATEISDFRFQISDSENGPSVEVHEGNMAIDTHASSTATALTVEQDGSGNIVEFRTATLAVMTIKNDGDITIAGGNMEVCVGACPDTETFKPSSEGDLGVEAAVFAEDYRVHCPEGWVEVSRDNKHTFNNFCIMKNEFTYEDLAQINTDLNTDEYGARMPVTNVSLTEAKNYCRSLGTGYHLTTDAEWMTIAEDIAGLPINDISDKDGLQLANGNNSNLQINSNASNANNSNVEPNIDTCNLYVSLADAENAFAETCQLRGTNGDTADFGYTDTGAHFAMSYNPAAAGQASLRTHVLPNGQIIWDIAGNAAEWVDELSNADEQPTDAIPASEWLEYSAITKYANMSYIRPSDYTLTSANGAGMLYTDYSAGSATRGAVRGGSYLSGEKAGVFGLDLSHAPSYAGDEVGFRCAK